jgi:TolA-binding protein
MKTMKTAAKTALVLSAMLAAAAGTAAAQTDAVAGSETGGAAVRPDPEQAAQLARVEQLVDEGRLAEARVVLRTVVENQQLEGTSAAESLLKLARIEHGLGKAARAAAALDAAAADAEAHGKPALQARALLDAAATYAALRRHDRVQARLGSLASLAGSAELPAELKAEIQARVGG